MSDLIESETIEDPRAPGISYRIDILADHDASPADYGLYPQSCYTASQYEAWQHNEWCYVGVVVTPVIGGMEFSDCSESLWAVEFGDYLITDENGRPEKRVDLGMNSIINDHPVPDMLEEVRGHLAARLSTLVNDLGVAESSLNAMKEADGS
jgi:hypothetical protein